MCICMCMCVLSVCVCVCVCDYVNCCTSITGVTNVFTILPTNFTLQPDETSAIVNITIIDDQLPEDDRTYTYSVDSQFGSSVIQITIQDNDCEYIKEEVV